MVEEPRFEEGRDGEGADAAGTPQTPRGFRSKRRARRGYSNEPAWEDRRLAGTPEPSRSEPAEAPAPAPGGGESWREEARPAEPRPEPPRNREPRREERHRDEARGDAPERDAPRPERVGEPREARRDERQGEGRGSRGRRRRRDDRGRGDRRGPREGRDEEPSDPREERPRPALASPGEETQGGERPGPEELPRRDGRRGDERRRGDRSRENRPRGEPSTSATAEPGERGDRGSERSSRGERRRRPPRDAAAGHRSPREPRGDRPEGGREEHVPRSGERRGGRERHQGDGRERSRSREEGAVRGGRGGQRRGRNGTRGEPRLTRPGLPSNLLLNRQQPLKPTSALTLPPKPVRVLIVGGGTGGHIIPALAIGEALRHRNPQTELLFVGSNRGLEQETIAKAGFRLEEIAVRGFPRGFHPFRAALAIGEMFRAFHRIRGLIGEFKPTVMVGTGGYVTVPGALAAKLNRVPLVLQEQNSIPGRANRTLSYVASEIHIHFTEARRYFRQRGKLRLSGNPVRVRLPEGRGLRTLQKYRLFPDRRTVLILGGSQGAHTLNEAFRAMLRHFRNDSSVQFVIQTGKNDYKDVLDSVRDSGVRVVVKSFLHEIEELYGVSHLVVARAGAMTISEISACGLPSVLVPYPHAADDHQTSNARALSDKGAAILVADRELTGDRLAGEIKRLLGDPGRLREMGRLAYALSRPDAAQRIAESVERLGGGAPEAVLNLPENYDLQDEDVEARR